LTHARHSAGAAKRRVRPESDRETSPITDPGGSSRGPIRPDLPACVAGRPAESSVRS